MSRKDIAPKSEQLASKIAKIEPMNPETMDYGAIKDELLMRLHDAELLYVANLIFNSAMAFAKAQRAITESDIHEGYKAIEPYIKELPNFENAERTKALWLELIRRKDDPVDGSLVKAEQFELIEVDVVDEFGMSQADLDRLNQLEFAIQKGVDAYRIAGEALREIRDAGLYKQHGTFEAYCEAKWNFSRSRAYQLIGAEEVADNLLTAGVNPEALPENEAQARALAAVAPEKQAEVWNQARSDGKPSAGKIKAIANKSKALPDEAADRVRDPELRANLLELAGEWNSNLWETPDHIARSMANLLIDGLAILEPCAGTGQIAKAIVALAEDKGWEYELTAIEILKERAAKLEDNRYFSIDADFLEFDFGSEKFDVILTNPPFDIGMRILKRSLEVVKADGRCLFLLPSVYFQTQERAKEFFDLNCHIHKAHPIIGRVPYLKEGVAVSGRQCEDAVFDIRLGKEGACMEFIWQ